MSIDQKTWKLRDGSVLVIGRKANYYFPDGESGRRITIDASQARLLVRHASSESAPQFTALSAHDLEVDRAAEAVLRLRGRSQPR